MQQDFRYCTMRSRAVLGRRYTDVGSNCYRNRLTGHELQPAHTLTNAVFNMNHLQESLPMEVIHERRPGLGSHDSPLTACETDVLVGAPVYQADMYPGRDIGSTRETGEIKDLDNNFLSKSTNRNHIVNGILSILSRDLGNSDEKIPVHQSIGQAIGPLHGRVMGTPDWSLPKRYGLTGSTSASNGPFFHSALPPPSALSSEPPAHFNVKPCVRSTSGSTPSERFFKTTKPTRTHKATNDNTVWLRCEICDCLVNSQYQMGIHNEGLKHRKKLSQLKKQMQTSVGLSDPYSNADHMEPLSTSPNRSGSTLNSPRSSQQVLTMISSQSPCRWVPSYPVDLRNDNFWRHSQIELPSPGSYECDSAYSGSDNDSTASL